MEPAIRLRDWALSQNVQFHQTEPRQTDHAGIGLIATAALGPAEAEAERVLLTVPRSLVIAPPTIRTHAEADEGLRRLIAVIDGRYPDNPRILCMVFLLYITADASSPVSQLFSGYTDTLPTVAQVHMPTVWTASLQSLLAHSEIGGALMAKMAVLENEFDTLRSITQTNSWAQKHWWGQETLDYDKWKWADAIYRSRVLDLPGLGMAMVPVLDMANHDSTTKSNARYDADPDGNPVLLMREEAEQIHDQAQVTISYDSTKSSGEMLYSYGFIEDLEFGDMKHSIYLHLTIPQDDPFAVPKEIICRSQTEKGIQVIYVPVPDNKGNDFTFSWHSDNIWLFTLLQEDGLTFPGWTPESDNLPVPHWNGEPILLSQGQTYGSRLREIATSDLAKAKVYVLRATFIVMQETQSRAQQISATLEQISSIASPSDTNSTLCERVLRDNYFFMLTSAAMLESECEELSKDPSVQQYLAMASAVSV